jgi:hypothetical protein
MWPIATRKARGGEPGGNSVLAAVGRGVQGFRGRAKGVSNTLAAQVSGWGFFGPEQGTGGERKAILISRVRLYSASRGRGLCLAQFSRGGSTPQGFLAFLEKQVDQRRGRGEESLTLGEVGIIQGGGSCSGAESEALPLMLSLWVLWRAWWRIPGEERAC